MSLTGDLSPADIAAVTGTNNNGLFGGDGLYAIIVLIVLMGMMGGGWGGGFSGNAGAFPWLMASGANTNNDVHRGFDQSAVMNGINSMQSSIDNVEIANCNRAMAAMQTAYTNQIASMNQSFANAQALDSRLETCSSISTLVSRPVSALA